MVVTFHLREWCMHAGCVFITGTHLSRTWTSGSFESVQWNACVHRPDLSLYSHLKEFWGNGVRTHVNSKGKIPSTRKTLPWWGLNPQRCIKQDTKPKTLPTSYSPLPPFNSNRFPLFGKQKFFSYSNPKTSPFNHCSKQPSPLRHRSGTDFCCIGDTHFSVCLNISL